MPTYEYTCALCGYQKEVRQKITDEPIVKCEQCDESSMKRGPGGGIGLSFKGSGFYITDYKNGSSPSTPSNSGECCPCGKDIAKCTSE